ncbi:hypothetical protein Pfo_021476 [Paulownia fortunei]|nr:hypothetical protein Pfo_021476 [Paulownia fortunei]
MAKEIVSTNTVVVFSKTYCPFCVSVKKLLTELGACASFKAIELDTEGDGSEIQSALAQWTGPNVFIGGRHIGGCDATTAMHKEGKLVPLLRLKLEQLPKLLCLEYS